MQHVLSQLISKRAELKGEVKYLREKLFEMENVVDSLDVAIKVFDPEFNLDDIRDKRYKKRSHIFTHGEANRLCLDILRRSSSPLTMKEIVQEVMKKKKLNYEDLDLTKNIEAILRTNFHKNDLITSIDDGERIKKWKIA